LLRVIEFIIGLFFVTVSLITITVIFTSISNEKCLYENCVYNLVCYCLKDTLNFLFSPDCQKLITGISSAKEQESTAVSEAGIKHLNEESEWYDLKIVVFHYIYTYFNKVIFNLHKTCSASSHTDDTGEFKIIHELHFCWL